jgi:hypothetical protein
MCSEASTVLRAAAADFFFNCWYLVIPSDNRIRHIPRCVHYHAQGFRLSRFVIVILPSSIFKSGQKQNFGICLTRKTFGGCIRTSLLMIKDNTDWRGGEVP